VSRESIALVLLLLSQSFASSCVVPYDNLVINESTTLCQGDYQINDTTWHGNGGLDGVIIINGSNVVLDCNGSVLRGNDEGWGIIVNTRDAERRENITIKNCDVGNYGISIFARNENGGWGICSDSICLDRFVGTFRNLVIRDNNISGGFDGIMIGDAYYALIEDNNFESMRQSPLSLFNSQKVIIRNNRFRGTESAVNLLFRSDDVLVVGNDINVTLTGISGVLTRTMIINNIIEGGGIDIGNWECKGKARDIVIFNNIIRDAQNGIVLTEFPGNATIANFFDGVGTEVRINRGGSYWGCSYAG